MIVEEVDAFEQDLFERDFAFACNLMLGKDPQQAARDADTWIEEAREEPAEGSRVKRVRRSTASAA